jgi:hypothetical protein
MKSIARPSTLAIGLSTAVGLTLARPGIGRAHRDALDGPVVTEARRTLEQGSVATVLKWVKREAEQDVRRAFALAVTVRKLGPEAKELADRSFFETLVRLHRAAEGAPFTGLKAAGAGMSPAIDAGEQALETGAVEDFAKRLGDRVADGVRRLFAEARETKLRAGESVAAGRAYVAAYVRYIHFVEKLHRHLGGSGGHR